jgi:hypothetical protein
MRSKRVAIIIAILLVGIVTFLYISTRENRETEGDKQAKQIISDFIRSKKLDIQPNTEEYSRLMKGILLGEYPELTGRNSAFVKNQEEIDLIIGFAAKQINYKGGNKGTDIPEAPNP